MVKDYVGSVERLDWARGNGCPWTTRTCAVIALGGHLDVLKRAVERGCPFNVHPWYYSKRGSTNPLSTSVCEHAAQGGHLDVLNWARAQGVAWSRDVCEFAALGGHLRVLQWARENGCPWYAGNMCTRAAQHGHLHVLKWVHAQGCGLNESACYVADLGGHAEALNWLREHGCPEQEDYEDLDVDGSHWWPYGEGARAEAAAAAGVTPIHTRAWLPGFGVDGGGMYI
jgi:hypothetical protein